MLLSVLPKNVFYMMEYNHISHNIKYKKNPRRLLPNHFYHTISELQHTDT